MHGAYATGAVAAAAKWAVVERSEAVAPTASYKITQKAEGACDRDGESGPRRDARFAC